MIIAPSDLRKLLTEVERDFIGHPNKGFPLVMMVKIFGPTINY